MTGPGRWWLVVPVKDTRRGKSRLAVGPAERTRLARALAVDTLAAAVAAPGVSRVVAVVQTAVDAQLARATGALVVTGGSGLAGAIARGLAVAPPGAATAVLLGDVPAAEPQRIGALLAAVTGCRAVFVPDADGTGTTLTASGGRALRPRFGPGSARAHRLGGLSDATALGEVHPSLRRDVDTVADLRAAAEMLRPGSRTLAAMSGAVLA